ncbi:carbonic anhydrase-like [Anopheles bellator]|uniref:carbonic anhydrase-like n=1 Tax=Anopheles bellator TaxID=139047 RepID=UPI002647FD30|nr:carbonic anhydrase-like [Anopheles bellator]
MSRTASRSSEDENQSSSSLPVIPVEGEALVQSLAETESHLPAPIDINVTRALQISLPQLSWLHYDLVPSRLKLANVAGQTVILSARWERTSGPPTVAGGPLSGRYVFSQLHFHWGATALDGSEHTVDGDRLPLELHLVHYNERFDSQDAARLVPGGILCVVYFFKLSPTPNRFLAPLLKALTAVLLPDSGTNLKPFPLCDLFHPFTDEYFVYWGSLDSGTVRTPLLWMLSRRQESIEFRQLKKFNRLLDNRLWRLEDQPPNRAPSAVLPAQGRHLFHANPRTPMVVSTLAMDPPEKYIQATAGTVAH